MTTRTYATLDRNRIGDSLLLDESDLQITTNAACDGARKVLGTLAVMSGTYAYECYVWSTSRGDLTGLVSIGVAQPDSPLDAAVGNDYNSWGLWPSEGTIVHNNSTVSTPGEVTERVCVGVKLELSPSAATCTWYVDGAEIASASLPTGKAWLPAIGIGSGSPGDISAAVNFGAWRFDTMPPTLRSGWSQRRAGIETIYLSMAAEGWMSDGTGAPANKPFGPYVIDPARIVIRRRATPWWQRSGRSGAGATCTVQLDNSDGTFNVLRDADVRDAVVVLQRALASSGRATTAPRTVFTGVIERVGEPRAGTVELTLRDTLSRLDKPLPMRRVPPHYEAAGDTVPVGLGAQRSVQPKLLDGPTRTYLLGDEPATNIVQCSDMAAPLDPNALPPQYTPALSHCAVALETDVVGRLAVDYSTIGQQYEIPGAADVLGGIGTWAGWSASSGMGDWTTTPPPSCTFSAIDGRSEMDQPATGTMRIKSYTPWVSNSVYMGEWVKVGGAPLLAGRSYRLSLRLTQATSWPSGGSAPPGGLMVRMGDGTGPSNLPADAISAHGVAIAQADVGGGRVYTFDFRVPVGADRSLYLIAACPNYLNGISYVAVRDLRVELLGQYIDLPMDGISVEDAFTEILVERAGEDAAIFNAADCAALDALGYVTGFRWEDAPNILDALSDIADTYGAVLYTDAAGVIRVTRLVKGTPVARFDAGSVQDGTVRIAADPAAGLTTAFAGRPNCTPFGDADFVTDTAIVTPARKAALTSDAQILLSAGTGVAGEYSAAIGAERKILRIDDRASLVAEASAVVAQHAERRQIVTFTALFDGDELVSGLAPEDVKIGDTVTLHLPDRGLDEADMVVLGTSLAPANGTLEIVGWL